MRLESYKGNYRRPGIKDFKMGRYLSRLYNSNSSSKMAYI
jgi:hypothetical protein